MLLFDSKQQIFSRICICLFLFLASHTAGAQSTPAEAAEMARQQTGGKVIWVKDKQGKFLVRVMMPNGQLRHVNFTNRSKSKQNPGKSQFR
jgi:cytoskeletal protein RodZ